MVEPGTKPLFKRKSLSEERDFGVDFKPLREVKEGQILDALTASVIAVYAEKDGVSVSPATLGISAPFLLNGVLWAKISGGVDGTDYHVTFKISSTVGRTFARTPIIQVSRLL